MTNKPLLIYEAPTINSSDTFVASTYSIVEAAKALKWNIFAASRVKNKVAIDEDLETHLHPCFVYGSIQFIKALNLENIYPGVFGFFEDDFSTLFKLPRNLIFNETSILTTWADLYFNYKFFFNQMFDSEKLFIRPNKPFKVFSGQTISPIELLDQSFYNSCGVVDETIIVVDKPREIKQEIRCFVVNNKVVETTFYNGNVNEIKIHNPEYNGIAKEFVENVLESNPKFKLPSCSVVDIAFNSDDIPKVLEINSISSSGIYGANALTILSAMEPVIIKRYNNTFF